MDVEKLKKMNVLADTLKTHGLAATREDAAHLAGDMVGGQEQEFSKIFVPEEQSIVIQDDKSEPTIQETQFTEQDVKNILQSFADQFTQEVNRINDKLEEHEHKLSMHNQVVPEPEQVEPAPEQVVEEKPKESPRSGGYESEDVSIEKFFYYGTK